MNPVRPERIERSTDGFVVRPSIQLRYGRKKRFASTAQIIAHCWVTDKYLAVKLAGRQGFEPWVEI